MLALLPAGTLNRMPRIARTWNTERLRLVPIGPELVDDLYRLHQDPGIARWHSGRWTWEHARERAESMGQAWRRDGIQKWMAYDQVSGALIGRGGLSYQEIDGTHQLEIGWAIAEPLWGQGYASEIGNAGLGAAYNELNVAEVVAFTEPYNRRSRAVMERLGFAYSHAIRHRGEPFVLYTHQAVYKPSVVG